MWSTLARPSAFTALSLATAVPPPGARGLTVRYRQREEDRGSATALDALDLVVHPGEVFCVLCANGAGKTTTIDCFLGFVQPSAGSARRDSMSWRAAPPQPGPPTRPRGRRERLPRGSEPRPRDRPSPHRAGALGLAPPSVLGAERVDRPRGVRGAYAASAWARKADRRGRPAAATPAGCSARVYPEEEAGRR